MSERQQRVVLNGKNSDWCHINAGVPQGSVLGPLFFLVYINDLVDNISSDAKLFANNTSLFTVVYNEETSATVLHNDLNLIKQWAFQWKMQFNPDVNKQAVEVIFSCKRNKPAHPPIFFNDIIVKQLPKHKHLGLTLDSKLTYAIISARTERFSHTYFPYCVREWNQLDSNIRTQLTVSSFKRKLIAIIRPEKRSTFKVSDLSGIKLLICSRVKFSDLCEHKFRQNFYITPMCLCNEDTETIGHYLLCCQLYADRREILFDTVSSIIQNDVSMFHKNDLCSLLLYGDLRFNEILNRSILESTIKYIYDSGRFTRYV